MKSPHILSFIFFCSLFTMKADVAVENEGISYLLITEDMSDAAEQTRFTVNTNLTMNDSISSSVGNVIKAGIRFIHNYPGVTLNNTFVGIRSGNFTMTGGSNSGFGVQTLRRNTTGRNNTAVGRDALTANLEGNSNTAVGRSALAANTNGTDNTAVGFQALALSNVGSNSTALGSGALSSYSAGFASADNTAIGKDALHSVQFATQHTAVGAFAGANYIGQAVQEAPCIFLGYKAGINATTGNFNIYIGNPGVDAESGVIRIGESGRQTRCFIQGIYRGSAGPGSSTVFVGSDGSLGTISSSKRFKSNIKEMTDESYKIFELTPVSFVYNEDETRTIQYGLIAEEVDAVFPALVVHDTDGAAYTVRYEVLPVLLLNEMKKQKQDMQRYEQDMQRHENDITMLKQMVADLHARVQRFVAG